MERFLPVHDVSASYEIRISAPPAVVYQSLLRCDFGELWLVRLLMTIRTGKRSSGSRVQRTLPERLRGTGFVVLAESPEKELVIGVAGKFWRPDGGRCMDLTGDEFVGFSRDGFAKAVWNFKLTATADDKTSLSTETRIYCLGRAALWKFRAYWVLVGPFSGLIRKAILKRVKIDSEKTLRGSFEKSKP